MKKLVFAAIMLAATMTSASAVTEFRGGMLIKSATAACSSFVKLKFFVHNVRYTPSNVGTNGTDELVTIFDTIFAQRFRLAGGDLSGAFQAVQASFIGRGLGNWATAQMAISQLAPSNITVATKVIRGQVHIKDYDATVGCNIIGRFHLRRVLPTL